jgi:hypothetical protein
MPAPTERALARSLKCHPAAPSDAVRAIDVRIGRMPGGMLTAVYTLDADLGRVRIPALGQSRFTDRLWQHTCCELFVARAGWPPYHELNFSPSTEWAVFAFARYRDAAPRLADIAAPRVSVRITPHGLVLEASVHLESLSPEYAADRLSLAISAVVEDEEGNLSYWALEHAGAKPDFHHPQAFALELDEVRD